MHLTPMPPALLARRLLPLCGQESRQKQVGASYRGRYKKIFFSYFPIMSISISLWFRASAVMFFLISISSYLSLLSLSTSSLISDPIGVIVLFVLFMFFVGPSGLIFYSFYKQSYFVDKYRKRSIFILFILFLAFHLPYLFSLYITFLMGLFYELFPWAFFLPFQLFVFIAFKIACIKYNKLIS
jgi:hypothetical protein